MTPRSVHQGHAPSCSATGSVVGLALLSFAGAAAVLNAFTGHFNAWAEGAPPPPGTPDPSAPTPPGSPPAGPTNAAPVGASSAATSQTPRIRMEADGATLAWPSPPAILDLSAADAERALAAGATPIGAASAPEGALTAPNEVHIALSSRCPVRCDGCYLDAGPTEGIDAERKALLADLDALAALGVFEVAIGGGDAALRDDLPRVLQDIRDRGMVANLTTSGIGLSRARVQAIAPLVGQVNISLDGLGDDYIAVRGFDGAPAALRALDHLRAAGVRTGVNTVLTRVNLRGIDALADALVAHGVSEWQWIRFKPAGRGAATYDRLVPTPGQLHGLHQRAAAIEARTGLRVRFDCALVPWLAADANVQVQAAQALGVAGCPGGRSLWARGANGRFSPCSFAHHTDADPSEGVHHAWHHDPTLTAWRQRAAAPPEPCAGCDWREVCRGGCRVVAHHLTGDALAPDPECPRVVAWEAA